MLIDKSNSEKDLGITFDLNLNFDLHINDITRKANQVLGLIKRNFKHMDNKTFILLTRSPFPLSQQFNSLPFQPPFPFPIHLIHFQPQELDLHPTHHILIPSLFLLTHPIPTQFLSLLTQYPFQITQYPSLPTPPSLNPQALFPPRSPPAPSP